MTVLSSSDSTIFEAQIAETLTSQRDFFATGETQAIEFRRRQLTRLKAAILERQTAIVDAVKADLGRPEYEGYFEVGVIDELNYVLKRFARWAQPRRVGSSVPGTILFSFRCRR